MVLPVGELESLDIIGQYCITSYVYILYIYGATNEVIYCTPEIHLQLLVV